MREPAAILRHMVRLLTERTARLRPDPEQRRRRVREALPKRLAVKDSERQTRIACYTERVAQGLPLFN